VCSAGKNERAKKRAVNVKLACPDLDYALFHALKYFTLKQISNEIVSFLNKETQ